VYPCGIGFIGAAQDHPFAPAWQVRPSALRNSSGASAIGSEVISKGRCANPDSAFPRVKSGSRADRVFAKAFGQVVRLAMALVHSVRARWIFGSSPFCRRFAAFGLQSRAAWTSSNPAGNTSRAGGSTRGCRSANTCRAAVSYRPFGCAGTTWATGFAANGFV